MKPIPIGSLFGKWTVIGERERGPSGRYFWLCRCACGTERLLDGAILRFGSSQRCRRCADRERIPRKLVIELTGKIVGSWIILKRIPPAQRPATDINQCWLARCLKCKSETNRSMTQLRRRDGCHKCAGERRRLRPFEAIYNALRCHIITRKDRSTKEFSLSYEAFVALIDTGRCHYCHVPLTWMRHNGSITHHLDRADNSRGYTDDNCKACCILCNYAKGARYTYEQWFAMTECYRNGKLEAPSSDIGSGHRTYPPK